MKVFLSWSGPRSKAVAQTLRQWLPDVILYIKPWMSADDIDAGARWGSELTTQLADTRCGIICLTKDNQTAPWMLFEAGALSKTIDKTYVIPYLIDLAPSDILSGPLTQFQAKRANENETWQLICTLNGALDNPLGEVQLERMFKRCWNELETGLQNLPAPTTHQETRSQSDMLVEVLNEVRRMARAITDDVTPQLNSQASRLELIERIINPSDRVPPPTKERSTDSSKIQLPKGRWNPHERAIMDELNRKRTVRFSVIEEIYSYAGDDPQPAYQDVVKMKKDGKIDYNEPLRSDTIITKVSQ